MTKKSDWRVILLAAAALVACCAAGASGQSLSNGNFESWAGIYVADNWTSYLTSGGAACYKGSTFTGTPTVSPHSGLECQRVKLVSSASIPSQAGVYQRISSTSGATYTVSAYLLSRLTSAGQSEAKLGLDPTGAITPGANTVWSSTVSGDSSWSQRTVTVTAAGSYVTIFLDGRHPSNDTTQCNVFFDDVAIQDCVPPAAPTNTSANPDYISSGNSSTLSATAQSGCTVDWYTGDCGGTLVGSGLSLVVSPTTTTTYYPRARRTGESCESTSCGAAVTVTVTAHPVVTITPSNMAEYGWHTATSNGGTGTFGVGGGPLASEYAGVSTWPMGRGGFYATCDEISGIGDTPSTVWLGLDKLYVSPGVFKSLELIRLEQIKKLVYKTYVPTIPSFFVFTTYLNYPWQPIHVTIATEDSSPPYLDRNWYLNMPWPYDINVFNNQNNNYGHWDTNSAVPSNGTTAGWYCADPAGKWDTWEQMCADNSIGTKKLVPTSTAWDTGMPKGLRGWKSCGYTEDVEHPELATNPPGAAAATGTGTAINFYVGARDDMANLNAWYDYGQPMMPWWKESFGFHGCLDEVTIGVQFDDIGYVETTYNLEPDPETPDLQTVAMSQKQAILPAVGDTWRLNPIMQSSQFKTGANRVTMCGWVVSSNPDAVYGVYFDLLDGSVPIDVENYDPPYPANPEEIEKEVAPQGVNLWQRPLPVRVHVPYAEFAPSPGEYWAVTGFPHVLYWDNPIPEPAMQGGWNESEVCGQLYLYSSIENCRRLW